MVLLDDSPAGPHTPAPRKGWWGCATTPISSELMQAPILARVPESTLLRRGFKTRRRTAAIGRELP
jgi:hypothetical protein